MDQEHTEEMRKALNNCNADLAKAHPNYVVRVVSDEGKIGRGYLDKFMELETLVPTARDNVPNAHDWCRRADMEERGSYAQGSVDPCQEKQSKTGEQSGTETVPPESKRYGSRKYRDR